MMDKIFLTVCTNDSYVKGVLLLKKSLEKVNTKYPLLCVCPDSFSKKNIRTFENHNIYFEFIENVFTLSCEIKSRNIKNGLPHYNESFFKLNIFGLIKYKKFVYLDSDMIVLENIDELFEMPHMTACAAGRLFPGNENWIQLNSGVMVIEPSADIFDKLKNIYISSTKNFYGDQDVINELYPEWPNLDELHLTEHYNLFYGYADYYSREYRYDFQNSMDKYGGGNIKIIHYAGKNKPWIRNIYSVKYTIKKMLSNIKHFKRYLDYRQSVLFKIDKYYKKINGEIKNLRIKL
jgi:alpha-N-acetylglucosamine transferase